MAEIVTLELPESITQQAREIAHQTGRSLQAVLTEWLQRDAANEEFSPLVPHAQYAIFTLYGDEAAAHVLLDYLKATEAGDNQTDQPT